LRFIEVNVDTGGSGSVAETGDHFDLVAKVGAALLDEPIDRVSLDAALTYQHSELDEAIHGKPGRDRHRRENVPVCNRSAHGNTPSKVPAPAVKIEEPGPGEPSQAAPSAEGTFEDALSLMQVFTPTAQNCHSRGNLVKKIVRDAKIG
jgi:hypothetical protein